MKLPFPAATNRPGGAASAGGGYTHNGSRCAGARPRQQEATPPKRSALDAAPARGDLALIPGSMGDHSWVAMGQGLGEWLWSCSHGAGRSVRRQAMRAKPLASASRADAPSGWECVTLREERRIEEAPGAYKPIGPVMAAQQAAGLIHPVARLRPWVTFKA